MTRHKIVLRDIGIAAVLFMLPVFMHWQFFSSDPEQLLFFSQDSFTYSYWWSYFYNKFIAVGQLVFWNPYNSLGYPAIAQVTNVALYPMSAMLRWFFDLNSFTYLRLFNLYIVLHFSLAAVFSYLFLRTRSFAVTPAAFGSLVYILSTAAVGATDGFEWLYGFAWFPLSLTFLFLASERKKMVYWLLLGLTQSMIFTTNFFPGIYQEMILLGVTAILLHYRELRAPVFLFHFLWANLIALLIAAPSTLPLLDLVLHYSERTKSLYDFAMFGLTVDQIFRRFLTPDYLAFKSAYFGISAYIISLLVLFMPRHRPKYTGLFVILALFIFFFGSGPFFMAGDFLYLFCPGYDVQRMHFRITLYLGICFAFFAAGGFEILRERLRALDRRVLHRVLSFVLIASVAYVVLKFKAVSIIDLWPAVMAICTATFLLLWVGRRLRLIRTVLLVLFLLEMLFVFKQRIPATARYLRDDHRPFGAQLVYKKTAGDMVERYFEGDRLPNGIDSNVLVNQARVRGYVTPQMERTAQFMLFGLGKDIWGGNFDDVSFSREYGSPTDHTQLKRLAYGPRLFMAGKTRVVERVHGEADTVYNLRFLREMSQSDLHSTVFLEKAYQPALQGSTAPAGVKPKLAVVSFTINRLEVKADVGGASPQWLVFVDSYHRDWQARLDGVPVDIHRADYAFKAVIIPPGSHTVVFEFIPRYYYIGRLVRGVTLAGIALFLLIFALRHIIRMRKLQRT